MGCPYHRAVTFAVTVLCMFYLVIAYPPRNSLGPRNSFFWVTLKWFSRIYRDTIIDLRLESESVFILNLLRQKQNCLVKTQENISMSTYLAK